MRAQNVQAIVRAVLAEQKRLHKDDIDDVVKRTIATMLTSFGMDENDRVELRRDFAHLRCWHKSVEQAQSYTFKILVTAIIGGLVGAVWLGIKTTLGKA
jgi:hypothetical protein